MCVTLFESHLGLTTILAHEVVQDGRKVRVLAYRNLPFSYDEDVNAMILPIPSAVEMSPANFIDGTGMGKILDAYMALINEDDSDDDFLPFAAKGRSIQVFKSGAYTVVLAKDASFDEVKKAILSLPEEDRPDIESRREIFEKYQGWYPGWHLALCIWTANVPEVDPILFWYEPMEYYRDRMGHWLPGLDAHDGETPNLDADVDVDHVLILGASEEDQDGIDAAEVIAQAPEHLRKWLPSRIIGVDLRNSPRLSNGDWCAPLPTQELSDDWYKHRLLPYGVIMEDA